MTINTVTPLNFRGDARAAFAFYHSVFGGNQMLISYVDAHNVQNPAAGGPNHVGPGRGR